MHEHAHVGGQRAACAMPARTRTCEHHCCVPLHTQAPTIQPPPAPPPTPPPPPPTLAQTSGALMEPSGLSTSPCCCGRTLYCPPASPPRPSPPAPPLPAVPAPRHVSPMPSRARIAAPCRTLHFPTHPCASCPAHPALPHASRPFPAHPCSATPHCRAVLCHAAQHALPPPAPHSTAPC